MTQKFDPAQIRWIGKFDSNAIVTAVYVDQDKKQFMLKRFRIETTTLRSKFLCIKEGAGNFLEAVTTDPEPVLAIQQGRGAQQRKAKLKITKMAEVTGWRTVGVKMADYTKSTEMEWVNKSESAQSQSTLFDA
jgi:topoisomerase-4 subunit A